MIGNREELRFAIQGDEDLSVYRDYPVITDNLEHNRAIFGSYTAIGFSEGLDRFVQGTYIGGILDIFRIEEGNILPHRTVYLYEPVFEPVDGAPSLISWGAETTIGFQALDCSNRYIYTLLNGVKGAAFKAAGAVLDPPYTDRISVFDWEGLPIRSVILNTKLVTIAVKNDNAVYLIAFDKGYSLVKIAL